MQKYFFAKEFHIPPWEFEEKLGWRELQEFTVIANQQHEEEKAQMKKQETGARMRGRR
mgnify:CR=1 FL=1